MPIALLPPRLANQIAAGEVVERPASVVKELIENSLDAGADKLEIDIEKGGHKRIKIRDTGKGIVKDELSLALSRHATSKISTLDDLEQIASLGFRGEALASISSVSRLTLTSRPADQEQAWQALCEGREMEVKLQPAAHPYGTTIDVVDLFYNTPARRKFLRTEKTEFQHIEDVVKRIGLSRPDVTFVLRHNGKVIRRFQKVPADKPQQRIAQVVGQKFVDNAVTLDSDYGDITIKAWLGNVSQFRSSTDNQYSFVNGRGMRDKLMLHAIRQAYELVLHSQEQPSFVFYLDLPATEVDVNVHPAKHEVRFQQSRLIHDYIVKSVCDALANDASIPTEQTSGAEEWAQPTHEYIQPLSPASESSAPYSGNNARQSGSSVGQGSAYRPPAQSNTQNFANYQTLMTPSVGEGKPVEAQFRYFSPIEHIRLYQKSDTLIMLDVQKLAPTWFQDKLAKADCSQPLLLPVVVEGEPNADDFIDLLQSHYFVINKQGGKLRLQQVPAGTRHLPWAALFPILVTKIPTSMDALASVFSQSEFTQDKQQNAQIWHWLDVLSASEQWEYISEFGKVRTLDSVLNWWMQ